VFNRQGTRLLGRRIEDPCVLVNDVPVSSFGAGGGAVAGGRVRLSAQGFSPPTASRYTYCFAGRDDDLVVSVSGDNNLYIWLLPESEDNDISVKESLLTLHGHTDLVLAVRYDPCNDALASAVVEKIIKLWTTILKQ